MVTNEVINVVDDDDDDKDDKENATAMVEI